MRGGGSILSVRKGCFQWDLGTLLDGEELAGGVLSFRVELEGDDGPMLWTQLT